jgi:hypothetical protein
MTWRYSRKGFDGSLQEPKRLLIKRVMKTIAFLLLNISASAQVVSTKPADSRLDGFVQTPPLPQTPSRSENQQEA